MCRVEFVGNHDDLPQEIKDTEFHNVNVCDFSMAVLIYHKDDLIQYKLFTNGETIITEDISWIRTAIVNAYVIGKQEVIDSVVGHVKKLQVLSS